MKKALGATKSNLVARIESVIADKNTIDDQTLDELEGVLLGADLVFVPHRPSWERFETSARNSW